MTKLEPPQVNFEAIKDDTLEQSELDKLLENIQKERLKDIKSPIATNPITQITLKNQDKLEVVDLNVFEKDIITESVVQEPLVSKKKISTIEELLYDIQNVPKKDNQSLLMTIDSKLTLLMENQQKIMEKLGLTRAL